jgi:hypothetical protein
MCRVLLGKYLPTSDAEDCVTFGLPTRVWEMKGEDGGQSTTTSFGSVTSDIPVATAKTMYIHTH